MRPGLDLNKIIIIIIIIIIYTSRDGGGVRGRGADYCNTYSDKLQVALTFGMITPQLPPYYEKKKPPPK